MKSSKKISKPFFYGLIALLVATLSAGLFFGTKFVENGGGSQLAAFTLPNTSVGGTGVQVGDLRVGGSYDSSTGRVSVDISENEGGEYSSPGCNSDNCLTPPDSDSYHGIAEESSLRESILTWTNFFLGFLSLVAMVMIIYAGFLYVTAAGDEEQAGKAKNIAIWVAIGIILIFIAYPLVNTLIETGPSGSDLTAT